MADLDPRIVKTNPDGSYVYKGTTYWPGGSGSVTGAGRAPGDHIGTWEGDSFWYKNFLTGSRIDTCEEFFNRKVSYNTNVCYYNYGSRKSNITVQEVLTKEGNIYNLNIRRHGIKSGYSINCYFPGVNNISAFTIEEKILEPTGKSFREAAKKNMGDISYLIYVPYKKDRAGTPVTLYFKEGVDDLETAVEIVESRWEPDTPLAAIAYLGLDYIRSGQNRFNLFGEIE